MTPLDVPVSGGQPRRPSLATAVALMAAGEGGRAIAELLALQAADAAVLGTPAQAHYWLGLASVLAYDWTRATAEFRAFLTKEPTGWQAGWAYLHLGRVYEQIGLDDEASLAYRGCLGAPGSERAARRLAFDQMSRLAAGKAIGYGQASTRPADPRRGPG
jgi:TolA-binding protein